MVNLTTTRVWRRAALSRVFDDSLVCFAYSVSVMISKPFKYVIRLFNDSISDSDSRLSNRSVDLLS